MSRTIDLTTQGAMSRPFPAEASMTSYLARRLVWAIVSLMALASVAFFAINLLIPYDYATNFWFRGGVPAMLAARVELGLDRPLMARFLDFIAGLLTGGLGEGFDGTPVVEQVVAALPITLLTFGAASVIAYLLGNWIGRIVAWRKNRMAAGATTAAAVVLFTTFPPWLAFLLIYFGTRPLRRARDALNLPADSARLWSNAVVDEADVITVLALGVMVGLIAALGMRAWGRRHDRRLVAWLAFPVALLGVVLAIKLLGVGTLALDLLFRSDRSASVGAGSPVIAALALVLIAFGEVMLITRAGVAAEMTEEYVLVARAKGLPDRMVRDRHVQRNVVLPSLSRFLTGVPYLLTGLIILEREFQLGGLSLLFFEAIETANTPLIIGTLLVVGIIGLIARLTLDIIHFRLDPRIRLPGSQT